MPATRRSCRQTATLAGEHVLSAGKVKEVFAGHSPVIVYAPFWSGPIPHLRLLPTCKLCASSCTGGHQLPETVASSALRESNATLVAAATDAAAKVIEAAAQGEISLPNKAPDAFGCSQAFQAYARASYKLDPGTRSLERKIYNTNKTIVFSCRNVTRAPYSCTWVLKADLNTTSGIWELTKETMEHTSACRSGTIVNAPPTESQGSAVEPDPYPGNTQSEGNTTWPLIDAQVNALANDMSMGEGWPIPVEGVLANFDHPYPESAGAFQEIITNVNDITQDWIEVRVEDLDCFHSCETTTFAVQYEITNTHEQDDKEICRGVETMHMANACVEEDESEDIWMEAAMLMALKVPVTLSDQIPGRVDPKLRRGIDDLSPKLRLRYLRL